MQLNNKFWFVKEVSKTLIFIDFVYNISSFINALILMLYLPLSSDINSNSFLFSLLMIIEEGVIKE